ncbi:MAG: hypothetical protein GY943_33120 [Chloroflexi bacterium]|nr:hypothetical protein [Chloroflexota bacterium]
MIQKLTRIFFLFVMLPLSACSVFDLNPQIFSAEDVQPVPTANLLQADTMLPYDTLIAQADAVFLGRVSYISPTQSGEGVADLTHQIAFSVVQSGVDFIGIGSGVVMTMKGQSPVDDILVVGEGARLEGTAVHQLQVGDEVVLFAKPVDIAVGAGTHSVLMPIPELEQPFLTADHWDRVYTAATIPQANTN